MANTNTITDESVNYLDVEEAARESLSVHWRAVFAGVFISTLVYFTLMSLGLAIGAGEMKDIIAGEDSVSGLGTGAGLWLLFSVLISLFMGSYASGRVSGIIATRVGYIQGGVVAALFFTLMVTQTGMAIGAVGSGLSSTLGGVKNALGGIASQAADSPRLNGIVEDALGDLQLRSSVEQVSTGVLSRILRGDTNSAVNYLSNQAGISREEAQAKFDDVSGRVKAAAANLGQRAADSARTLGWAAFATMLFGTFAAMLGGAVGAQLNIRKPIDSLDRRALRTQRPAFT